MAGILAAAAIFSTSAHAAVITLPAETLGYSLWEYDLGAYSGRNKITVSSNRDMSNIFAYTADFVDWHIHPLSGSSTGDGADWYGNNQLSYSEDRNYFSIIFMPMPSSYKIKCCWYSSGEMVNYEEIYYVTPLLWANWSFAGGTDPITLTISVTPITGAVPEPATWAMMILGFGLVGAGVRRARAQSPAIT